MLGTPPILNNGYRMLFMLPVFILTLFLSSGLLFLVQPMVGKMILPYLGGVPAVWNTCMVFFQAMLLIGYAYSHFSSTRLKPTRQIPLHLLIMSIPFWVLPIAISPQMASTAPASGFPVFWILGLLFLTTGLPFFVVSTTAPMLQKWFSLSRHTAARDPYFLYAASNAGSMTGLLAYPFVLEPLATLSQQSQVWHLGYGVLFALTLFCGIWTLRSLRPESSETASDTDGTVEQPATAQAAHTNTSESAEKPTWQRRFEWILLSFIPSSLMLGLTTYISTDVASSPLLWVIPLAIYLLSFILVFARRPILLPSWAGRAMCLLVMAIAVGFFTGANHPIWLLFGLHILMYFAATMISHGRLAKLRPNPRYLTEYFLLMSVGGALGGIFNALIAPLIFTRVIEYMLVVALACAVREVADWERKPEQPGRDIWMPILPTVLMLVLIFVPRALGIDFGRFAILCIFGPVALFTYSFVERPRRFALALVLLIFASGLYDSHHQRPVYFERNFFGTIKVANDLENHFRFLVDGNTMHGRELLNTDDCLPLSYYHPLGPAGALFAMHTERTQNQEATSNIALIGVGIGSLTCYGTANQHWDLFEINPAVVTAASTPEYFKTLHRSQAGSHQFIVGDARLRLKDHDALYDIIVVDAFSSDSIPVHLLTVEAVELYLSKLTPQGIIAFNISNRVLDLEPVLSRVATASNLVAYSFNDHVILESEARAGKDASHWVFFSRDLATLGKLAEDPRGVHIQSEPSEKPWSDSFSNIVTTIRSPF